MVKRRTVRSVAPLARRSGDIEFTQEERQLIPQLLQLLRSGALASVLSSTVAMPESKSGPQPVVTQSVVKPVKPLNQNQTKPTVVSTPPVSQVGGWNSVKPSRVTASISKEKLTESGWSVPVRHSVTELSASQPGVCLASTAEAKRIVNELKGEHPLAILVPQDIGGKSEEVHVLVEDSAGRMQSRRRFLVQIGVGVVTYMDGKPKKSIVSDSVKVVLTLTKEHSDAETWEYALKNAQELTKKWLKLRAKVDFLDVRPPTRRAGATDCLQVLVMLQASAWVQILRASGTDGIFVRPFIETDHDRSLYKAVPMPLDTSLAASIRQAQFLGERAFGIVPYGSGFGIRVKSEHFVEVLSHIQPDKRDQFSGATWEISGLPLAMGKESLQVFLADWQVRPLHTFRQGFRRTWIVRSAREPTETVISHDFGLAVIKPAVPKRMNSTTERFQPPRPDRAAKFSRADTPMHAPKSWASAVAGDRSGDAAPKKDVLDGAVGAAHACRTSAAGVVQSAPMQIPKPVSEPPVSSQASPADLSHIMTAAIEAALRPLREKLEATIIPMQRTIASLQAEFISIREEKPDEFMHTEPSSVIALEQEAKRLKTCSGA